MSDSVVIIIIFFLLRVEPPCCWLEPCRVCVSYVKHEKLSGPAAGPAGPGQL